MTIEALDKALTEVRKALADAAIVAHSCPDLTEEDRISAMTRLTEAYIKAGEATGIVSTAKFIKENAQ